ncbi:MAG: hypothetical protein H0U86_08600 [Chloroflexi bacterium]|nr:hypothetical protein [Chloroflexota bacterium]
MPPQPHVRGTRGAWQGGMFALIRRFVIGWLLLRLVRRLTGGSARTGSRR